MKIGDRLKDKAGYDYEVIDEIYVDDLAYTARQFCPIKYRLKREDIEFWIMDNVLKDAIGNGICKKV